MTALPPVARLSTDLEAVLREAEAGSPMTLGDVEGQLKSRGFTIVLMLLAVPFIIPSIPGLSTPFGLAIMLMGASVLLGRRPQLPGFIRKRAIPAAVLVKLLRGMVKVARWMERYVRPRMAFLTRLPGMVNLTGLSIVMGGFILLLPVPIPFTNTLPALAIILLAIGIMERDGVCVLLGHGMTVVSLAYLAVLVFFGKTSFNWFTTSAA